MRTPLFLSALAVLAPLPQDGTPGLRELQAPAEAAAPALAPGELPADATPEARAAWARLCAATVVPGVERRPVTSFDLTFDGRVQTRGSHDVNEMRFLYRAPNWVSSRLSEANTLLRGPKGDWLVGKKEVVQLRGREAIEDRRQLDDTVNIASNFATLTDPSRMRLAELAVDEAPSSLPPALRETAAGLLWVRVASPDLRLYRTGEDGARPGAARTYRARLAARTYRARLGLDAETSLPRLVLINAIEGGRDVLSTALLVRFDRYKPLDGYVVPHQLETRSLDPKSRGTRFKDEFDLALWLFPGGSLAPDLGPEDFLPPR